MKRLINIIKFIIIGIIQGVTEIFPVSSSGHLALCYHYFNIGQEIQLDLTIFLHLASSLALIVFFKEKISNLFQGFFKFVFKKNCNYKDDFKLSIYIVVSSIPVMICGFFIKPLIESLLSNMHFISIGFIISAIILIICSSIKEINDSKYNLKNTFITGVFQSLSVFPAISRSGITLFGSKIAKLDKNKSKEFTFLLLIPISIGSSFLSIIDLTKKSFSIFNENIYLYVIALITAYIFTYISLKLFFYKSNKIKLYYFSIYLILLSLLNFFLL